MPAVLQSDPASLRKRVAVSASGRHLLAVIRSTRCRCA